MRTLYEEQDFENECKENEGLFASNKAEVQKELSYMSGEYVVKDYFFAIQGGFNNNARIEAYWSNYIYKNGLPVHHFYQYDSREKTAETLQKELMNHIRVTNRINSRY